MKTITVKFEDHTKELLHEFIVANVLSEPRCRDQKGYELIITKDHFPQLKNLELSVKVKLTEWCDNSYPPEPPKVIKLKTNHPIIALYDEGEEVQSNLDANFEDKLINSLTL